MDAMTPGTALPLLDAPCCVSSGDAAMAPADAEALAKTLKALADPARLRIVSIIAAHDAGATCAFRSPRSRTTRRCWSMPAS